MSDFKKELQALQNYLGEVKIGTIQQMSNKSSKLFHEFLSAISKEGTVKRTRRKPVKRKGAGKGKAKAKRNTRQKITKL